MYISFFLPPGERRIGGGGVGVGGEIPPHSHVSPQKSATLHRNDDVVTGGGMFRAAEGFQVVDRSEAEDGNGSFSRTAIEAFHAVSLFLIPLTPRGHVVKRLMLLWNRECLLYINVPYTSARPAVSTIYDPFMNRWRRRKKKKSTLWRSGSQTLCKIHFLYRPGDSEALEEF